MFLPRTRPLAGISGVGQRRSTTEKETCAKLIYYNVCSLVISILRLSSHISLAKTHGLIISCITTSFGVIRKNKHQPHSHPDNK